MPTGATLVFSHGQSRENNSWASTVLLYRTDGEAGWKEDAAGTGHGAEERLARLQLYRRPAAWYRHKFALKVEKPEER